MDTYKYVVTYMYNFKHLLCVLSFIAKKAYVGLQPPRPKLWLVVSWWHIAVLGYVGFSSYYYRRIFLYWCLCGLSTFVIITIKATLLWFTIELYRLFVFINIGCLYFPYESVCFLDNNGHLSLTLWMFLICHMCKHYMWGFTSPRGLSLAIPCNTVIVSTCWIADSIVILVSYMT